MDMPKTALLAGVAVIGLAWSLQAPAQVFKCVDASSGKTTFSDRGCTTNDDSSAISIRPANSIDGSQYRQQATKPNSYDALPTSTPNGPQITGVGDGHGADHEGKKLCKQASTPYPGSQGPTANQRAAAAKFCAGASPLAPAQNRSASPSTPPIPTSPPVVTNCDSAGCWDSHGVRYNKGAGDTYFPSTGGPACQRTNGIFSCP